MRNPIAFFAALALMAGCSGPAPTPEEEALPETGQGPEMTANSAAAGINSNSSADTMPQAPGGPVSDQAGADGDTTSTE